MENLFFKIALSDCAYNKAQFNKEFLSTKINNIYDKTFLLKSLIEETDERINNINKNILFLKSLLKENNLSTDTEKQFFTDSETQKQTLQKNLEELNEKINNLHNLKNRYLNLVFDKNNNYIENYKKELEQKRNNIIIGTEKDNNVYVSIDKRQNLSKNDIKTFLYKLYLKEKISKNEYRKAIKHGVFSENVKNRIHFYNNNKINKVVTKREYKTLSTKTKNLKTYYFNDKHNILVKYRFSDYIKTDLVNAEIDLKINQEKKVYSYCKI